MTTNVSKSPPTPGLVYSPKFNHWVRPTAGHPGDGEQINAQSLQRLSPVALRNLQRQVVSAAQSEKNSQRFNDLVRIKRAVGQEVQRREVSKALNKAAKMSRRMTAEGVLDNIEVLIKGLSIEAAIPLEQIKGDLARAGHIVKTIIALDPDAHRIFFMDSKNNPLYAEFADASGGFALQKVGPQADIAKEYNVVDLEPDADDSTNLGETVATENEEREYDDTPGIIPAGTPGEKPEQDEQDYEDAGQFGEGLGDPGFDDEERHQGRRDTFKAAMADLDKLLR